MSELAVQPPSKDGDMADLVVENFAHIRSARIPLCDLTVLVGPQATGKSLILQLLKLYQDRTRIARVLWDHGQRWSEGFEFTKLYFGEGFEEAWTREGVRVAVGSKELTLKQAADSKKMKSDESVFYIPAHRTLTISDGWPQRFMQLQPGSPYVARRFSEQMLELINRNLEGGSGQVFPMKGRLKAAFRKQIDQAVFHGGTLKLQTTGLQRQFRIEYDQASVPFMSWTAGQREFIPFLLGLYHLLPAGKISKLPEVDWVIIEEPEMGLHPKATVAVLGTILDLLQRGYRVALSTHSPTVLETLWAIKRLQGLDEGPALLCELVGLSKSKDLLAVMQKILGKSQAVVYLHHNADSKVESTDISELKPGADGAESSWGGLTEFSARAAEVVARAANVRRKLRK